MKALGEYSVIFPKSLNLMFSLTLAAVKTLNTPILFRFANL